MPDSEIKIYPSAQQLAEVLASEIAALANEAEEQETNLNIALCGGTTPKRLYSVLSDIYAEDIPWGRVHLFWSDERCVPYSHADSNYGFAREHLLDSIPIPSKNIHFIKGDADPESEAERYSSEIENFVEISNNLPRFDLILLGVGSDGHTASIFSDRMDILSSDNICETTVNPENGQKRVTLTGNVINNAASVVFIVTGVEKSEVVAAILDDYEEAEDYTAAYIFPEDGLLNWYLDEDAAADLR
jgi:6-phosphogluconolactonase